MRVAGSIEPRPVIEARRLGHQRVALPVADRVPSPRRVSDPWEFASIRVDLPIAPRAGLEQKRKPRWGTG